MKPVTNLPLTPETIRINDSPAELDKLLRQLSKTADDNAIDRVISLYGKTLKKYEKDIWNKSTEIKTISQYQSAFKVLEKLYSLKTCDNRYHFKIVIPVADRPQHLQNCLKSLLTLCRHYEYGGIDNNNQYHKISVLIADDSSEQKNIKQHIKLCKQLNRDGINTEYFGLSEQAKLVAQYTTDNIDLSASISSVSQLKKTEDFSHKGASVMRNITYLKLNRDIHQLDNTLIYFIDSDQEFCVNHTQTEDRLYAINYFHYLNEIFKTQNISILTGKVVGDPPVSPAVMASNFQQDVLNFITTVKQLKPEDKCQFHQQQHSNTDDAAYHDMANLFGFSADERQFDYHCNLQASHSNRDCFHDFSEKMQHFFYGEHPTRKTFFEYGNGFTETKPARTVYTGNYVIKPENLKYFIPFATLKLRMAGPVLGRILQAGLKNSFVSANLPMLHKRTVNASGLSEYRAGVKTGKDCINLANEFSRQFYGDVMLFSIIEIYKHKKDLENLKRNDIYRTVEQTYQTIKQNYDEKHLSILSLKTRIRQLVDTPDSWWHKPSPHNKNHHSTLNNIDDFLNNIENNFSQKTSSYREMSDADKTNTRLSAIANAIYYYHSHLHTWDTALLKP